MDKASVKKWGIFFAGILCAILIGDTLSNLVVNLAGLTGWVRFSVNFILYAGIFFSVLYLLEKWFHIRFFGFSCE